MSVNNKHLATLILGAAAAFGAYKYSNMSDEEKKNLTNKLKDKFNKLKDEAVAYDALSVVVNTRLKVPGLTVDQLRDIYIGKITNWSQVNGPNLPIVAFSRAETAGGTVSSFVNIFDSNPISMITFTSSGIAFEFDNRFYRIQKYDLP